MSATPLFLALVRQGTRRGTASLTCPLAISLKQDPRPTYSRTLPYEAPKCPYAAAMNPHLRTPRYPKDESHFSQQAGHLSWTRYLSQTHGSISNTAVNRTGKGQRRHILNSDIAGNGNGLVSTLAVYPHDGHGPEIHKQNHDQSRQISHQSNPCQVWPTARQLLQQGRMCHNDGPDDLA